MESQEKIMDGSFVSINQYIFSEINIGFRTIFIPFIYLPISVYLHIAIYFIYS